QPGGLENVDPVIQHVEVAIQGDSVNFPGIACAEFAEELAYVFPLKVFIGFDTVGQVLQIARNDEVRHPLWVKDISLITVGLGGRVLQDRLIQIGEWHGYDVDRSAGQLGEVRATSLQRFGNLRAGKG